jgi:hypothetical protein
VVCHNNNELIRSIDELRLVVNAEEVAQAAKEAAGVGKEKAKETAGEAQQKAQEAKDEAAKKM